ncbi:oleosin 16 kDa [Cocos nucifera]|uniref:Oleosin 16 kDa n=2 Tax=Cocos nucifera TaxID=13894 RepID=A0A1S6KW58_COCNU|nr:oleosin isoform 500c [Cocos nucifera]KAG1362128.1 oleosin 16 kDa [Cocos nucifera]
MAEQQPTSHRVVKGVTAATIGGSLLLLSGLTLAGTVIGLAVVTPLLVIFSPVLVPAVITVFLLVTGFVTSGVLGVAALSVLSWLYKYLTGKRVPGAEQLEQARARFASKARDVKESAQHRTEQA